MLRLMPVVVATLLSGADPGPQGEVFIKVDAAEVHLPKGAADVLQGVNLLKREGGRRTILIRVEGVSMEAEKEITLLRHDGTGWRITPGDRRLQFAPIGNKEPRLIAEPAT